MTVATRRIGQSPMPSITTEGAGEKIRHLARRSGKALGVLAAMAGVAAAVVALRLVAYALGHGDQPLFHEISRLWS